MHKITCARWLAREIEEAGETVLGVVPNAVDPREFFLEAPIETRGPRVVALYHRHPVKGPDVLIAALDRLRAAMPEVRADVIAARPPSHRLPPWVDVHLRLPIASLRALYNRAAVVLHTSRSEGWGLVPMEAAACGCAVAATANEGVREYLADGETMRVDLLWHPDERIRLARAAGEAVARYRWPELTARFEALLQRGVAAV
jgi:glycosyltransferase involved in cell wall biosynthesis